MTKLIASALKIHYLRGSVYDEFEFHRSEVWWFKSRRGNEN
jgi:hypothetical protein